MSAPRSLQARLSLAIASVLSITLCGFSLLLYAAFHSALQRHFDSQLLEDARAVGNMVEERPGSQWQFEPGAVEYLEHRHGGLHFAVRMDDGRLLARSPGVDVSELRVEAGATGAAQPHAVRLPGGDPARLLRVWLPPRQDDEAPGAPSGRRVRVDVARRTVFIDANLAWLRLLLTASFATSLLLATCAAVFAIRRGLRPIARVSARADTIDASHLEQRLPSEDLPHELQPAVHKLNDLLARLQRAFERERQFTADASHELRTPLAGLRSILEVAVSRPRGAAEYRAAIEQALEVVQHMHRLVEQLLLLSRVDLHAGERPRQAVDVRASIDACFAALASAAQERRLVLDNRVDPSERLDSDRDTLALIITNLLRNAVQYAEAGTTIVARSDLANGCVLSLTNQGRPIPGDALDLVFRPFVRLEQARGAAGGHFGIGLALVRKLCEELELRVVARNPDHNHVCFEVFTLSSSSHI